MENLNYLFHYYEKGQSPFCSLTSLSVNEAKAIICKDLNENTKFDVDNFLNLRYKRDETLRSKFISIGGKPVRKTPVYFTLGDNKGMKTWYKEPNWIKIPVSEFDKNTISFTYGDSFAVFNPTLDTGEEWWDKIYFYDEVIRIVEKYGFPEDPEYHMEKRIFPKGKHINNYLKYVEAHIWSNDILEKYNTK